MSTFESQKGKSILYILFIVIMVNISIVALILITNNYVFNILSKMLLICCNIYMLYYLLLAVSLKYIVEDEKICILGIFGLKKVEIPINSIKAFILHSGKIRGVRLSGICNNNFALGRSIIDKVGVTRMFVTSNVSIIYLKTDEINYGISPREYEKLEQALKNKGIVNTFYENNYKKNVNLYKEKKFILLFTVVSLIVVGTTVNPFVLYLKNALPATMPLSFDAAFAPIIYGTSKQFAFKQMVYGVLNMLILFCMYYASYFHAKYDKKSSYIYMYISLLVSLSFFVIQLRILHVYWV